MTLSDLLEGDFFNQYIKTGTWFIFYLFNIDDKALCPGSHSILISLQATSWCSPMVDQG